MIQSLVEVRKSGGAIGIGDGIHYGGVNPRIVQVEFAAAQLPPAK